MDSITQAALGAAVAEAGMGGRRLGNKAVLWGIALGTLPDLDILAYPWLDAVQRLEWHRGLSHSLAFTIAVSPLLGWIIARIHRDHVSVVRAAWTVFAVLFTHVLIDVFTVYGTAVFLPFTDLRIGFNNLFIIDPLYTLPLLLGTGGAVIFARRHFRRRAMWNWAGLLVSSGYVVWSFGAKAVVDHTFRESLDSEGIPYERRMSMPTPFNTILWRGLVLQPDAILVGYVSLLARDQPIVWERIARNPGDLGDLADTRAMNRLRWFSDGFYGVRRVGDDVIVNDWRFGETRRKSEALSDDNPPAPIFSWRLEKVDDEWMPIPIRPEFRRSDGLEFLRDRLTGETHPGRALSSE